MWHRQERIGVGMTLWPTGRTRGEKAIQARVVLDKNTIERMLAPDLYVQTPDRKLTRQEFIDAIFSRPYTLTRFDATVLTVEPRGNDWAALVLEKLEGEIKDK